jgi:hypothetical protein
MGLGGVTLTQLNPIYCTGGQDFELGDIVQAEIVPDGGPYRFTFFDGVDTHVRQKPSYGVFLYDVPGLEYGKTYQVTVEVRVNGVWSPPGSVCAINMLTQPPATQVNSAYCNGTYLYPQSNFILADQVLGATGYEFRFDNGADPVMSELKDGVSFQFHTTDLIFNPGIYQVDVRAYAGNTIADYQDQCPITIIPMPELEGEDDQTADAQAYRTLASGMELTLFPNPNDGRDFIVELGTMDTLEGIVLFQVMDASGRVVHVESVGAQGNTFQHRLRMDAPLAEGLYTLSVWTDGNQLQQRFVVSR